MMHRFVGMDKEGNRYTNVDCPHPFCEGKIVYNGNYFCEHWGDTCNWALEHNEYEQVYRKGPNAGWYQVIVREASPSHKEMWTKIKIDVWGSIEAYDRAQAEYVWSGPVINRKGGKE